MMFRSTKIATEMTEYLGALADLGKLVDLQTEAVSGYRGCSQRPNDVYCGQHWL